MEEKLIVDLKIFELKDELLKRNLATHGIKAALVRRLKEAIEEQGYDSRIYNFNGNNEYSSHHQDFKSPSDDRRTTHLNQGGSKNHQDSISRSSGGHQHEATIFKAPFPVFQSNLNRSSNTGSSAEASNGTSLWISNVARNVKALELKELFSKHGKVLATKIVMNAKNPDGCCFGFLEMASPADAANCMAKLDKWEFYGNRIVIDYALCEAPPSLQKSGSQKSSPQKPSQQKSVTRNRHGRVSALRGPIRPMTSQRVYPTANSNRSAALLARAKGRTGRDRDFRRQITREIRQPERHRNVSSRRQADDSRSSRQSNVEPTAAERAARIRYLEENKRALLLFQKEKKLLRQERHRLQMAKRNLEEQVDVYQKVVSHPSLLSKPDFDSRPASTSRSSDREYTDKKSGNYRTQSSLDDRSNSRTEHTRHSDNPKVVRRNSHEGSSNRPRITASSIKADEYAEQLRIIKAMSQSESPSQRKAFQTTTRRRPVSRTSRRSRNNSDDQRLGTNTTYIPPVRHDNDSRSIKRTIQNDRSHANNSFGRRHDHLQASYRDGNEHRTHSSDRRPVTSWSGSQTSNRESIRSSHNGSNIRRLQQTPSNISRDRRDGRRRNSARKSYQNINILRSLATGYSS